MDKVEQVIFSVAIVLIDTIMHSNSNPVKFRGQGHLLTLPKGHLPANTDKEHFV